MAGGLLGIALVAHDLVFHWTGTYRDVTGQPTFNALGPFPGPLLFYSGGAIIVEVFYRLLPIPLLMWIAGLVLRGRGAEQTFWLLAGITSLIEPATQDLVALQRPSLVAAAGSVFVIDYALNLVQAVMFRRLGFLAAILTRVATYVVWHVIYGNYICVC